MKHLNQDPTVKVEMLIRRPVHDVFRAFVDPEITTQFWFTKSSGRLEAGQSVRWDWKMYGASTVVDVKEVVENRRILIDWGAPETSTVEWVFADRGDGETLVSITHSGFSGNGDAVVAQALDSTQGFTMVLCGLKALLEYNIRLNLVADKAPDAHVRP